MRRMGMANQHGFTWFVKLGLFEQCFQLACGSCQGVGFDAAGQPFP